MSATSLISITAKSLFLQCTICGNMFALMCPESCIAHVIDTEPEFLKHCTWTAQWKEDTKLLLYGINKQQMAQCLLILTINCKSKNSLTLINLPITARKLSW